MRDDAEAGQNFVCDVPRNSGSTELRKEFFPTLIKVKNHQKGLLYNIPSLFIRK